MTFYGVSEDLCLLRWKNLKTRCAGSFGGSIQYSIITFSVFAKVPGDFVPNAISHYGRPSRFVLIHFHARRLDDSASVFVPHGLESCISHPKESELHLTASLFRYPNRKTFIRWVRIFQRFAYQFNERDTKIGLSLSS